MQRALNAIEMHGNDDEPDRPVEVLVEQQVSLNDPPLHNQQANVQVAQPDQLMNISVVAYCGCPSNSTISLLLQFSKTLAIALADTGSTNTFMDLAFAKKHNIPLTPSKQQLVTVAGGGTLASDVVAYDCKFSIQGHQFNTNFHILQLQGSDLILGVNWFKEHNPVTVDILARQLTIGIGDKLLTLSDHLFPKQKLLISSDKCNKLLSKGSSGYILVHSVTETKTIDSLVQRNLSSGIHNLLLQFQDIF
jgi:hypothetical protein